MHPIDMTGRTALVTGVANKRSLAWAIAQRLHEAGARICLTYQGERIRGKVEDLAAGLNDPLVLEMDVTREDRMEEVFGEIGEAFGHLDCMLHSIAHARSEDLKGNFRDTPHDGWVHALQISAWSLLAMARHAAPIMEAGEDGRGGSILAMTYLASQRAMPNYNVMGSAKAALEQSVRQLAFEMGPMGIRVNALSPGPVSTLSARGVSEFTRMLKAHRERAPLQRNVTLDEVGGAGFFLMSDLSGGITGEILHVDGGFNIMGM
jgi:enoyl-[acyl-carrier protein] reductase I